MIQRASDAWLHKHPDPITAAATLRCDEGDTAVAFDSGQLIGAFGPGQHDVSGSAVDVFFVRPSAAVKIGCQLATRSGRLRGFGELLIRVTDPVALIRDVTGVSGGGDVAGMVESYVQRQVSARLTEAIATASLDQAGVAAALGSLDRAIASGIELDRFVHLTLDGPGVDLTVRPPAPSPAGPTPGTPVWAYWTDGNWYPATVREIDASGVLIQWDSGGNTARLALEHLKPR